MKKLIVLIAMIAGNSSFAATTNKNIRGDKSAAILVDCVQNNDNIQDKDMYVDLPSVATKIKIVVAQSSLDSGKTSFPATAHVSAFFRFESIKGTISIITKKESDDKMEIVFTSADPKKLSLTTTFEEAQKKNVATDDTLFKIDGPGTVKILIHEEMNQVHTCSFYGWDD